MINEITKTQVDKIMSDFLVESVDDYNFTVKGVKPSSPLLQVGSTYEIKLRDYVVNEPPNFTLSSNWNGGKKFYSDSIIATVVALKGKMILIDAKDDIGNIYKNMYIPSGGIETYKVVI